MLPLYATNLPVVIWNDSSIRIEEYRDDNHRDRYTVTMSENTTTWGMTPTLVDEIASGYDLGDESIALGALIDGDSTFPEAQIRLPLKAMNRHGLIAGATGTGKTRTLQLIAEGLASHGVSVFLTDVKGDLTGLAQPGVASDKLLARTETIGQEWKSDAFTLEMLTLGAEGGEGTPVRATVTDFGPLLMAKVLDLNTTQEQALQLIFSWADQRGLALIDLKDLKAVVQYLTDEGKAELKEIGGISSATAGVILRSVSVLESQGGDVFFGTPAFDTKDFFRTDADGRGVISSLAIPQLDSRPALVSTFIMWLLADLFDTLPEVGDQPKPKLVFFFDEAHLLFKSASPTFLDQVVQTVKLIRSKGVGVFFITQTPQDVPEEVLSQLGSRVMHALRAYTPKDVAKLKDTVSTFPNTPLDLEEVITNLGTGEALVTVLGDKGVPTPVAPTRLCAPAADMGVADADVIRQIVEDSEIRSKYRESTDPYSAFEALTEVKPTEPKNPQTTSDPAGEEPPIKPKYDDEELEEAIRGTKKSRSRTKKSKADESVSDVVTGMLGNAMRSFGTQLGREISRTIFGTRRRRR